MPIPSLLSSKGSPEMHRSIEIALVIVVTAAACSDFLTRRIPNWITLSGVALGLAGHIFYDGVRGAVVSVSGIGLGATIFIVLYLAGGMGAGDVKLFGAVGALLGPQPLILAFVCTGLLGGIAAVALSARHRRLDSLRMPYGVIIASGTLMSLVALH